MSPNKLTILPALALVVLLPFLTSCSHTVEVDVHIAAPPSEVWAVLSDASSFETWNPVQVRLEGEFREGETVRVYLREPSGKSYDFESTVRRVVHEKEIHQGGGTWGIFTFDHTYRLEPTDDGGTKVTQREEFAGMGVAFMDMSWTEEAYTSVNAALKAEVEARAARKRQSEGAGDASKRPLTRR